MFFILKLIQVNIFLGYKFNLDYFVAEEKNIKNNKSNEEVFLKI